MSESELIRDKAKFIGRLLSNRNLSKRSASDCFSRCKRVEKVFSISLYDEIRDEPSFLSLMKKITKFASSSTPTTEAAYALTGCLKAAVRKYAEFKFPEPSKEYPKYLGARYSSLN